MTENTLPEYISENQDGSLSITMKDGRKIVMREPRVRDQRAVAKNKTDEERGLALIGNLAGLSPDEIDDLTLNDQKRLGEAFERFLD